MIRSRTVVIGDIHGNLPAFLTITQSMGLLDRARKLSAADTTIVLIGDICDRGVDSKTIYELVMDMQSRAAELESDVYFIIGNHEVMNVFQYTQDTTEEDFMSYASYPGSDGRRERREAFGRGGWIYEWLLEQHALVKKGPILFGHGDVPMSLSDMRYDILDRQVLGDIREHAPQPGHSASFVPPSLFSERHSVLWSRDALPRNGNGYAGYLEQFLHQNRSAVYICGHTPSTDGSVKVRYNGRYVCVDTAMGFERRGMGRRAALEIDHNGARAYYFHRRRVEKVPLDISLNI